MDEAPLWSSLLATAAMRLVGIPSDPNPATPYNDSAFAPSHAPRSPRMASLPLAEIIAARSQITGLGMGQLPEPAIRSSLVATSLTRLVGIEERVLARWTHGS